MLTETAPMQEPLPADLFAEAYRKEFRKTVRLLNCRCGLPPTEAEEFAQAAWVQGWQSRATLHSVAALPFWVNTIAMNLFRTEQRRAWRREELSHEPTVESSPTAGIEAVEALQVCSPRDSRLLANRYLIGRSIAELASRERVGATAIRVRLSRARKRVREAQSEGRRIAAKGRMGRPANPLPYRLEPAA